MAYDLQIGAATAYMEASGELPEGQQGVCHVLVNRLKSGRWGSTLTAVCLAPYQFSSWNTSDPNRKRFALISDSDKILKQLENYLQDILDGNLVDTTSNALWYFNPTLARPAWAASYVKTAKLGSHVFYKEQDGINV